MGERLDLTPGSVWTPACDTCPVGPYFAVLAKGRALLVTDEYTITTMLAGLVITEGLAADYQAYVRATTFCEIYRIRMVDLLLAVSSGDAATKKWFSGFTMLKREAWEHMYGRLISAHGARISKRRVRTHAELSQWKELHCKSWETWRPKFSKKISVETRSFLDDLTMHQFSAKDQSSLRRGSSLPSLKGNSNPCRSEQSRSTGKQGASKQAYSDALPNL